MIDITKEEFWGNKAREITRLEKGNSKIKKFILKNKIIITLIISLSLLMTINIILIYNFLKILATI